MKRARLGFVSGAARLPELALLALVLAGLVETAHRFIVDGKLPQPYIFDINDTFMDWFNTAYFAHNPGAYEVWHSVYPPLSFVFLKYTGFAKCYANNSISARDCDTLGIFTILMSYALCVVMAFVAFRKTDRKTSLLRGIAFGAGLPLLFTLERGNLILPCFICFVFAQVDLVQSRLVRFFAIAATINFKPYMLLPVLTVFFKRDWRALELAGMASIFLYLVTYAIFGSGSPFELIDSASGWLKLTSGLIFEQVYYSTSFTPFLEFNTYRFPTRDFVPSQTVELVAFLIPIVIHYAQALAALALAGAWVQPQALTSPRISMLVFLTYLISTSPGGYTETFVVFLVFLEKWERPGPMIAITMAYLLCVSYDVVGSKFIELNGDSWLSGRSVNTAFGISLGMVLRPALMLGILISLSIDSLLLIVRAHRTHRPSAGILHPAMTRHVVVT